MTTALAPGRAASHRATTRRWRVLIADDNADIVAVLTRLLAARGYETLTASDGEAALTIARREAPDLILLDWMMPRLDGLEVCRRLKADPHTRGIMVVLVTGRGSVGNRIEGFDAGADDFIPKPFHHPELLARVRSALRIKELTDELSERNRQIVESRHELVRQEKMATIGLLASGIAHEFNNIMAGISGYAQLARRNPKHLPQLVEVALTQSERAEELTNSLSAYHRQDSSAAGCDAAEVTRRALCLVKKLIESKGIRLRIEAGEVAPVSIAPGQLQEIVLNLLINAVHAIGPEGGEVFVGIDAGVDASTVLLTVRDTGHGIPAEHIEEIFDPFFTTKGALGGGREKGTGLGLSVCYNIVQSRGGRIAVASEVGKGSTFTVTLPVHAGTLPRSEVERACLPSRQPVAQERKRVLVVDDEAPIRQMLCEHFAEHDVVACASAGEAIRAYRSEPFDLVVLDVCMADSPSGCEALRAIKSIDPAARVVLASGSLRERIPDDVMALAHGHLLKPFQLDALSALLADSAGPEGQYARIVSVSPPQREQKNTPFLIVPASST